MSTANSFAPVVADTRKAINLSMQRLWLTGQVLPAGARMVVQHVFRSDEAKTMEVIYSFPLPRDAALRRFRITGEGFEAHSELKETEAAVKAYEEGISRGSLSTLARQYGDGVVNLTVGNIRSKETVTVYLEILCGVELRDDGFRFRFPFTLAPAYHSRAQTALTAPAEGEMELPADEFGDMILPRFREDASVLHQVGFELSIVSQLALDEIGSPSHTVRVKQDDGCSARVALAAEKDVPNRDLVLDTRFQSVEPQVLAGRRKDGNGHFAAIVPSTSFGVVTGAPRRVVILLDRSGSMQGEPISQACKAIEACLGVLSETDSFGLVAFDNDVLTFKPALVSGTRELRDEAHEFLMQVDARGSTELVKGLLEASKLLEGGAGDILILTDGQVSGTEKILADARSAGVRLHCLGIGSASQDRFLGLLARETGGVSRFLTPRERVDLSAVDSFASIGRPVASGLKAGANIQPEPPSFVFNGTPVLLFGEGSDTEENQIELSWSDGGLKLPVNFSQNEIAETLWLLQGSRLITDWESRYPSTEALAPLEKRKESRVAARLLTLSQTYRLASREMSLVAVVTRPGDRAGDLPETRVVPVGMAQDTVFGSYFRKQRMKVQSMKGVGTSRRMLSDVRPEKERPSAEVPADKARPAEIAEDILLDLASRLDSDGGMPGKNHESRASATVIALLAFLSQGHTPTRGTFRSHVTRLVSFLQSVSELSSHQQQIIAAVIDLARKGTSPPGEWITLAHSPGNHWREIESAVLNAQGVIKILVIGSCTGRKDTRNCPDRLTEADFADPSLFRRREAELSAWSLPARELYTGFQHRYMMNGVKALRARFGSSACAVKIVSAGYGLVDEDQRLVPYEATFQGKRQGWIQEQSNRLGIPIAMRKAVVGYDVVLFLLGKEYLISTQPPLAPESNQRLVFFTSDHKLPFNPKSIRVPAGLAETRFGAGITALKGKMFELFALGLCRAPEMWDKLLSGNAENTVHTLIEDGLKNS